MTHLMIDGTVALLWIFLGFKILRWRKPHIASEPFSHLVLKPHPSHFIAQLYWIGTALLVVAGAVWDNPHGDHASLLVLAGCAIVFFLYRLVKLAYHFRKDKDFHDK